MTTSMTVLVDTDAAISDGSRPTRCASAGRVSADTSCAALNSPRSSPASAGGVPIAVYRAASQARMP
jgi:hypothetical protein